MQLYTNKIYEKIILIDSHNVRRPWHAANIEDVAKHYYIIITMMEHENEHGNIKEGIDTILYSCKHILTFCSYAIVSTLYCLFAYTVVSQCRVYLLFLLIVYNSISFCTSCVRVFILTCYNHYSVCIRINTHTHTHTHTHTICGFYYNLHVNVIHGIISGTHLL